MVDPASGEVKKRAELAYPNSSGVLSTAGGIVVTALIDGTILAFERPNPRRVVADQRRVRIQRAADDLRGERQAIHRYCVGPVL